jgi:polyisoprenoid-binding protein YceI
LITFVSNKFVEVSPGNYEVDGDFAIRGASNPEELTLIVAGKGTASGEVKKDR